MKNQLQKLISILIIFGFLITINNVFAQSPPTFSTVGTFSRAIPEDFLGLNGANVLVDTEDWDEINSNNALAGSPMKTFRFPGGTVSNYWDWRRGFFLTDNELPTGISMPYDNNPSMLPENRLMDFRHSLDRVSATAIFDLNILSSDYHYQLGSLYAANALNMPVKYIELGTELYLTNADNLFKFPGVNHYLDESLSWTQSLKQHPQLGSAKVALVGATSSQDNPGRQRLWLQTVMDKLSGSQSLYAPDAITLHYYCGTGINGPIGTNQIPTMLSQPFFAFEDLENNELSLIQNSGSGMEVWLTEFNLFSKQSRIHGTWAHGLYTAVQSLTCLQSPLITKLTFHTMSSTALFGSIFSNVSGFNYPPDFPPPINIPGGTSQWEFTASGYALDMVATAMNHANQATAVEINSTLGLSTGIPDLYAWYFQGPTSDEIIVVNLGEEHYGAPPYTSGCNLTPINSTWNGIDLFNIRQISGNLLYGMDGGLTTVSAPPVNFQPNDYTVNQFNGQVQIGNVTFAPYSVTRLWKNHNNLTAHITDDEICENTSTTIRVTGGYTGIYSSSSIGVTQPDPVNEPWLFEYTAQSVSTSTTYTLNFTDGMNSSSVDVTVHPAPTLTVTTNPNTPSPIVICAGNQVDLSAGLVSTQPNSSISYVWTPSHDISTGTPTSPAISVTPSFDTDYQVFATDGYCWVAGPTISVQVAPGQLNLGDNLLLCNGQQIELVPDITGGYNPGGLTYLWSTGATSPTLVTSSLNLGINTFSVTVTDVNTGCPITDAIQVSVVNCCNSSTFTLMPDAWSATNISNFSELHTALLGDLNYNQTLHVLSNTTLDINGIIEVGNNFNFAFENCTLNFSQDAQILLDKAGNLKFENCTLRVCNPGTTWNGVLVSHKNARLIVDHCTFEDAQSALQLKRDASFTIIDNNFSNCYISIDVQNYFEDQHWGDSYTDPFSATTYFNGYITGNHVSGTGMLGEPYLSLNYTRPLAGINLNNVLDITVGLNQQGDENYIQDTHYGIWAYNTSLTSYNNVFDNIYNYDVFHGPWIGCGIYSRADFDVSDRSLTIGSGGSQGTNTFLNSDIGVYAYGDLNCLIRKNDFGNGADPSNPRQGRYSLFIDYPRDNPVYIGDNRFYDFQTGICGRDVGSFGTGQFIAEWNEFREAYLGTPTDFYGTAIMVHNPMGLSTGLISINDNTIDNPRRGIFCRMALKPRILNNSINFDLTQSSLGAHDYTGIATEETDFADISHNTITQSTFLNTPSLSSHLIGLSCREMNTAGIWCNQFHNLGYSMNLMGNCLGTELHNNYMHNYDIAIWTDNLQLKQQGTTTTNWENVWMCDDQGLFLGNYRVAGTLSQPLQINWYHHGSTIPTNANCPVPSDPIVVNPIPNVDFILPDACGGATERKMTEENRDAYFESSITPGGSNTVTPTYLEQNEVYKTLDFDTSLVEVGTYLDPNFEIFYTGIQNSNIALFNQVRKKTATREFSEAQALNGSMADTNLAETAGKYLNGIYFQLLLNDSLSSADSSFLEQLSSSDPVLYGNAVFGAGSMLLRETAYSQNSNLRLIPGSSNQVDSDIEVYPNPCSDYFEVQHQRNEAGYFELYDAQLKLVMRSESCGKHDARSLSPGIYELRIFSTSGRSINSLKLIKQ